MPQQWRVAEAVPQCFKVRLRFHFGGNNVLLTHSANDPSAGSPTETLLRLLLPLSDKVHATSRGHQLKQTVLAVRGIHRITQSVGATGGVYKGQGRNQHELITRAY